MHKYIRRPRIIPCLLLSNTGLVKTRKFKDPIYLGDPRNVVKIFNDKEVDELVLLDITATPKNQPPQFDLVRQIVSECFAPLGYGGGIRTVEQVRQILEIGIEKVIINSHGINNPKLIEESARLAGSSSVVASIDVKKELLGGFAVFTHGGHKRTSLVPVEAAKQMENAGAGEILLNAIDRDGTMNGYDLDLIQMVAEAVAIPVVACGGAGTIQDMVAAVQAGAAAAAAGSLFVFHGKLHAVLISFPSEQDLNQAFAVTNQRSG